MGHYELISACFFGKLALKKHFFEVHTPKFADPPPKFTLVVKFFYFFFLVASLIKHHLSNTFNQIPFIEYHLSNTIYQISFIKYHLSITICSPKFFFNQWMNQWINQPRTAYLMLKIVGGIWHFSLGYFFQKILCSSYTRICKFGCC